MADIELLQFQGQAALPREKERPLLLDRLLGGPQDLSAILW